MTIHFVSDNYNKYEEAKLVFKSITHKLEYYSFVLSETKDSQLDVVHEKAQQVLNVLQGPFIVDDTCLYIKERVDYPGVHTKQLLKSKSYEDFIKYIKTPKRAYFKTLLALKYDAEIKIFEGIMNGELIYSDVISYKDYNAYFYPDGYKKNLSQFDIKERVLISHRAKAFEGLNKYLEER